MAIVGRSWMDIGIEAEEGSGIAEAFRYCALNHIVRIENLDAQQAKSA
jgi:hypothetical protein